MRVSRSGVTFWILILATMAVLAFGLNAYWNTRLESWRSRKIAGDLGYLASGLEVFHSTYRTFPEPDGAFELMVQKRIIGVVPVDPWGNSYVYKFEWEMPVVTCLGADGVPGGVGSAQDVSIAVTGN